MTPHFQTNTASKPDSIIWTEGKTDWKHIKKAFQRLAPEMKVAFHEYDDKDMGDAALLSRCRAFAETPQPIPLIFVFDRDNPSIVREVSSPEMGYQIWGNNVFSLAIPIPKHRFDCDEVCIELYYTDSEIKTEDAHGRRLYLSTEFDSRSGTHRVDPLVHVGNKGKLGKNDLQKGPKIVDADVYRGSGSIALSKAQFATYVFEDVAPFTEFDVRPFSELLDIVKAIIESTRPTVDIYMGYVLADFQQKTPGNVGPEDFVDILNTIFRLLRLGLNVFIASTIRVYEDKIIDEPEEYRKKVRAIKEEIGSKYAEPTLQTLLKLARSCYYLVDRRAPSDLWRMRSCLGNTVTLGPIGSLISDLEFLLRANTSRTKIVNRPELRKEVLPQLLPEFSDYESRIGELRDAINASDGKRRVDWGAWMDALMGLRQLLEPILSPEHVLICRSLDQVDTSGGSYLVTVRTYFNSDVRVEQQTVSVEEHGDYDQEILELVLKSDDEPIRINLFPFLIMREDQLESYVRTRATGYEYLSVSKRPGSIVRTKRKFIHSLFGVSALGDTQALFWVEAVPTTNPISGVKANIPLLDAPKFVGRKRQIQAIRREVIEIPNQNGIVFGLGGVGKTSIMLQLSRMLFEDSQEVLFDNIIWVSAKQDYFNPILNIVERRPRQIDSLHLVLVAILRFFEYDDIDEYDTVDLKSFVLDILEENKVLLVIDNFETIPGQEGRRIIDFFGVDAKYRLRRKPDFFKVIITSRIEIPSGFHQIELRGLDSSEAVQLINSLIERYLDHKPTLTSQQKRAIYEASSGIPIVIKHCIGQVYEFNQTLDTVLRNLQSASSRVVQFSFAEVFRLLKEDIVSRRILILLELVRGPMLVRQISDVLEADEFVIQQAIPTLLSLQCINRVMQGSYEKFKIHDEVRLFSRALTQEYGNDTHQIRMQLTLNFSVDKQMDYTSEELDILIVFNHYLSEGQYQEAKVFIREQLQELPQSILLIYNYAKYLKEYLRDYDTAIGILEDLLKRSFNHRDVLRLLVSCYLAHDVPNYAAACVHVEALEKTSLDDHQTTLEIGEFYVGWSTSIKTRASYLDPITEMLRQQQYRELADRALTLLRRLPPNSDRVCHLLAQAYYNKWDYVMALRFINRAIKIGDPNSNQMRNYTYLRSVIINKAADFGQHLADHDDLEL